MPPDWGILSRMPVETTNLRTLPGPRQAAGPYRVCLVCLGNICRSPMAEVIMRAELERAGLAGAVAVESTGTGDWHVGERMYTPAREELARRGYDGSEHRARQLQPEWLAEYDLILGMDRANIAAIGQMANAPDIAGRIRLLRSFDPDMTRSDFYRGDVPDPFGGDEDSYALTFELVKRAVAGLVADLSKFLAAPVPRLP
jgi:protein-tyrosine phosphatase